MKLAIILFLLSSTLLASEFDEELKFLEGDKFQMDEVKSSSAGIKKEELLDQVDDEQQFERKPINNTDLFFKNEEVKPRRIRSR
jgi:hypothetical protein